MIQAIAVRGGASLIAALVLAGALSGCAPLVVGGMVGGGLVATDRRTAGTQLEDETIEFKAAARARELATLGQIGVTSYNRTVLVTGQVPGEAEKAQVGKAIAAVENVRAVVNELEIAGNASLGSQSSDALIVTRIKAAMVDAKDLFATAYKVTVERGAVYLMGRVTEREAARGVELARAVPGVTKVVRVFEILSEEELARLASTPAPVSTATPVPAAAPPKK